MQSNKIYEFKPTGKLKNLTSWDFRSKTVATRPKSHKPSIFLRILGFREQCRLGIWMYVCHIVTSMTLVCVGTTHQAPKHLKITICVCLWTFELTAWCERCLLITESPKTPRHYRYLIWVLVYIPYTGLAVFSLAISRVLVHTAISISCKFVFSTLQSRSS